MYAASAETVRGTSRRRKYGLGEVRKGGTGRGLLAEKGQGGLQVYNMGLGIRVREGAPDIKKLSCARPDHRRSARPDHRSFRHEAAAFGTS